MPVKPHRSMLYLPGSNARALSKAPSLAADTLILDLEDAVAPDSKADARQRVVDAIGKGDFAGREVLVRINGADTKWAEKDILATAPLSVDGIVLPKVDSANALLDTLESINRAGGNHLPVWIMTETARGVLDADEIYGCSSRIAGVIMGTSDLARELRIPHRPERDGFLHLLSHCVLAARAHGLDILDGVHLNFRDLQEFHHHCEQGRDLGFDGKTLIHPTQIEVCNEIFSPSLADIENAREIITAWQQALDQGEGVCVVKGRLIENLHVEEARRTLDLATAIANRS